MLLIYWIQVEWKVCIDFMAIILILVAHIFAIFPCTEHLVQTFSTVYHHHVANSGILMIFLGSMQGSRKNMQPANNLSSHIYRILRFGVKNFNRIKNMWKIFISLHVDGLKNRSMSLNIAGGLIWLFESRKSLTRVLKT